MKTIRRDLLLRAAVKGQLWVKCLFHYTDDYAWDAANDYGRMKDWRQVWVVPADVTSFTAPEGMVPMMPWHFRSKTGHASQKEDGGYSLAVHSNLVYDAVISASDPNELTPRIAARR